MLPSAQRGRWGVAPPPCCARRHRGQRHRSVFNHYGRIRLGSTTENRLRADIRARRRCQNHRDIRRRINRERSCCRRGSPSRGDDTVNPIGKRRRGREAPSTGQICGRSSNRRRAVLHRYHRPGSRLAANRRLRPHCRSFRGCRYGHGIERSVDRKGHRRGGCGITQDIGRRSGDRMRPGAQCSRRRVAPRPHCTRRHCRKRHRSVLNHHGRVCLGSTADLGLRADRAAGGGSRNRRSIGDSIHRERYR